jgi:exopolysaccharide biosynthesis WecB/TagA/CpsF family protein
MLRSEVETDGVESASRRSDAKDPIIPTDVRRENLVAFVAKGFVQELSSTNAQTTTDPQAPDLESKIKVAVVSDRSDMMEALKPTNASRVSWPAKYDVLGVEISATNYDDLVRSLIAAARRGQSALVSFLPVHGVVTAALDPRYRYHINAFDVVAPDGQPVRWAINSFHKLRLPDRVCGPETMLRLCQRAAENGIGIYLYGSTEATLNRLRANLEDRFPSIRIVGIESPPFRELTPEENLAVVERINNSGAGFVFIGLGCPRQDFFAYNNRNRIKPVQMCVGAAFDFHAGNKKMAPGWMQRSGLEWIYRLAQEPRRLWKRYLVTNTAFILLITRRMLTGR